MHIVTCIILKYILKDGGAPLRTPIDAVNYIAVFYFAAVAIAYYYSRNGKSFENNITMPDNEYYSDELVEVIINSVNNLLEVDKNVFISTIDAIKVIGEDNIKTILNAGYNASMYLYCFIQK